MRQSAFLTPHVLIPWGCDFHFVNAFAQFDSMDLIISKNKQT